MTITYSFAMAAGRDAANRRMRSQGRSAWDATDFAVAIAVFNKLMRAAA
jgi:hypothetical protein